MRLDFEIVRNIAHLARLHISNDDLGRYAGELSAILAFVEQMKSVDTSEVIPMAHPLDISQPLRTDVISEPDRREEFQSNAPAVRNGLYVVPRVVE